MYTLPTLGFAYHELEPFFDQATMYNHHVKFHGAVIAGLNNSMNSLLEEDKDQEALHRNLRYYPPETRDLIGAHYNHSLFWELLAPPGECGVISEDFSRILMANFGSLSAFMNQFEEQSIACRGAGWTWLTVEHEELKIFITKDNENPLMDHVKASGTPVLVIDLWEHAYYLKYQHRKEDYLKAFWSVVNWQQVEARYRQAVMVNRL